MAHDPADGQLTVVAPLSTREVWLTWLRRRFPDTPISAIVGRTFDAAMLRAPIVFAHYDILAAWQDARLKSGTVIFDEAHVLTNHRAQRTKAALFLAGKAKRVIALTGTPLWNKPVGVWSLLALINPGGWGAFFDFAQRYGDPITGTHGWVYQGTSFEQELQERLTEVVLRRTWMDVAPDLPPIQRQVEIVDLTDEQRNEIDVAAQELVSKASTHIEIGDLARYRRAVGLVKAPVTADLADRVLASGSPVVVWTWHRKVAIAIQKLLARRQRPTWVVTGQTSIDAREAAFAAWRTSSEPAALIVTLMVGQTGLDFSHAAHAIFGEYDFTPLVVSQAEMRTFSPLRPMSATYVAADHDIDRRLALTLQAKCAQGERMGLAAADTAIEVIAQGFDLQPDVADMQRLVEAFAASAAETDDYE
jgi:SWI/SNF-related matrix-associated actin-dependent regulator 1 of chromatin subfamily A